MITKKILLGSSIAAALAMTACGEPAEETVPAEDMATDPAADMTGDMGTDPLDDGTGDMGMDAGGMDAGMTGEGLAYDVDGAALVVPVLQPAPDYEAMRDQELTAEQQERRDAIDVAAVEAEAQEAASEFAAAGAPLIDPVADGDASFAQLDRDGNDSLTPAEFAIYDLAHVNPAMQGAKDDGTQPYVGTEAINMAVDDFTRLDENGDEMLSREEFDIVTG